MKNRKTAIAAAAGVLFSITMIACACSEHHAPSSVYEANLSESLPEDADSKPDLKIESEPTPAASDPEAPEISEPAKPTFDDPDTYIQINPENGTYILPEDEKKLTEESLFVGDSICSGFWACGMIRSQSVYAAGAVGARNLLEYKMYYRNQPAKFAPVLKKAQPKNVFLWMGMNDVNMTTAEEFCENYRAIIDTALENSEAEIYVCAISPILDLEFTKIEYINEFNDAISAFVEENYAERVHFIDFTAPFKTDEGLLDEQYNGGDGIHLTTRAYYIAIHEINKTVKNN